MTQFGSSHFVRAVVLLALAASPAPAQLFAVGNGGADYSSSLYRIDDPTTSPVAVEIGETGVALTALAIHPHTGRFYAIDQGFTSLHELDSATGAASLIGTLGTAAFAVGNHAHVNLQASGYAGLEIDGTGWGLGAFYNNGQVRLQVIDPVTAFRLPAVVVAGAADLGITGLAWTNAPGLIRIGAGVTSTTLGLEGIAGPAGSSLQGALKITGLQQTAAGNGVAYLVFSGAVANPPIPLGSQFLFGELSSLLDLIPIVPQANGELTAPLNLQQAQLVGSYVAQIVQIITNLSQVTGEASMAIIANLN